MNILFFCRLFYPHIGGVEKHVMEVSYRLQKLGHTITIVTEQSDEKNPKYEVVKGISVYRIPVGESDWFKKFKIWKWMWDNKNLLRSANIVHCHDVYFWYIPFRLLFPNKKSYITFHGYESYPVKKKEIIIRKISEVLSQGNICVGDFINKWYDTKPTYVIYGATHIPKRHIQYKDPHSAVYIGRLDEQTGVTTYKNAYRKIKRQYPDFHLTVVGDGKLREKFLKNSDINVLGFKPNIFPYLEKNRFAFVSQYLALLEAMAYKRLAFAVFNNPLQEDYLKMAPFAKYILISPDQDISEKMLYYINNPEEEKKMVDNAYKWVKNQTWEEVVNTYIQLWKVKNNT